MKFEIKLKEIRKSRSLTQAELAEMLDVKLPTYRTWERGTTMMNLEQAYNCAVALGCTLDELAGRPPRDGLDADEREIVEAYRSVTFPGKRAMMVNARAVREEYVEKSDTGDVREATA